MKTNYNDKENVMHVDLHVTEVVDLVNLFHKLKSNPIQADINAATNFIGLITDKFERCHGMSNTELFWDAYANIVNASKSSENY